jgi:tetratricopeptide (TPR) repeat protein
MMRGLFITVLFLTSAIPVISQNQVMLDSLELRLKNAESDSIKVQVLLNISHLHYQGQDYLKAARYAQQAATLAHERDEIVLEQRAERHLFAIFFNTSDFKAATVHAFNALKLYEITRDSVGTVAMQINLGAIHDRLEEHDKALEYYLKAQTVLSQVNMDEKTKASYLTSLYNNIANVYQSKSNFQSARDYYEKSLDLARQVKNQQTEGIALNNLGKLYLEDLKQPEKAYQYLMEGLEIRIKLGDKNELPKSYINIANYYRGEKKYSEARQAADQALLLGKEIGSLFTQRDAYQAILLIEKERENFKESLEASENFKRLSDSIQSQLAGGELERLKLQL